ncbi:LCP family protein [Streptacidiphilus monticola]|uniref:LCP family protein n=1 Tax=Streptacidiphilus monticola TaxID=2161674 RepID=A0ABW1G2T3_9ACTN
MESNGHGRKRRRILTILAAVTAGLVLGGAGLAWYGYARLNANIRTEPLYTGTDPQPARATASAPAVAAPEALGTGRALNILVIGTDARDSAADCALGHDCGSGERADVEMVVHLSADRSNATVMSIPRDLLTDLPGCKDPNTGRSVGARYGMINSALDYGPGCSVAAVDQLTGLTMDHFVKVDFSGVVSMSDAVGGVSVCVDRNVYDPDSGLKLKQGTHVLKGVAALQFVRTRHGFLDGSDLGRTYTQHLFLSRAVNAVKSAGTLTDLPRLWSLASAATKALTVDQGLGDVGKLASLAQEFNKVPSSRITFVTMQNYDAPAPNQGRVLISQSAYRLFQAIAEDRDLSAAAPVPSGAASASAAASAEVTPPAATAASSSASSASASPSTAASRALAGAHAQLGSDDQGCAQVSTFNTIPTGPNTGITPTEAYARHSEVPDSAP